jgi:hypothetical protein
MQDINLDLILVWEEKKAVKDILGTFGEIFKILTTVDIQNNILILRSCMLSDV